MGEWSQWAEVNQTLTNSRICRRNCVPLNQTYYTNKTCFKPDMSKFINSCGVVPFEKSACSLTTDSSEPKMNKEDKQHELVQDDPRTAYPMGAPPAYSEKSNGGELDNTKNERHEVVSPLKMLDS
uniref:Uncharacterized protein n=1 Tax=Clytia hemisphaerica TaxID=252671 RepID=A0A7M5UYA1_9CNID